MNTMEEHKTFIGKENKIDFIPDKICPFLNNFCIKERCNLYQAIGQINMVGVKTVSGMCCFLATVRALAVLTQPPPQKVNIPHIKI